MNRRIVLIRHANAESRDALTDHGRPLSVRGRRDAQRIAAGLVHLGWVPERVLCSDARRAVETWELMQRGIEDDVPVSTQGQLYGGGMGAVRRAVTRLPDDVATVGIVGHNPGWEEVASWLTSDDVTIGTANAVLLSGRGDTWDEALAEPGSWDLYGVLRPKD